jgi:glycosyltransferase 2 family protein
VSEVPPTGERALTPDSLLQRIRGGRRIWIRLAVVAAVTIGVFVLLSRRIDYGQVGRTLRHADALLLLAAGLLTITFPVFSAFRWKRMLLALGYAVSLRDCFSMIMAAWPMGTITPSKSGDLMKAYYLKDRIPPGLVIGSVLAERAVDVLVLLGLALIGCLAFDRWGLAALSGAGLAGGVLIIGFLLRLHLPVPARFKGKIEPMLRSLRLLGRSPGLLGPVLIYTVLNWFASILQVVVCYRALGTHVPFVFAAGALPLAVFVGLLPFTLSGMGTRDSAIIVLFASYAPADVSLGVGILYSLFGYWLPALVGLPFLRQVLPNGRGKSR